MTSKTYDFSQYDTFYILDHENRPVSVDIHIWADWALRNPRTVEVTRVGGLVVSTVFLGVDHRHPMIKGPPILFETMVFDRNDHIECNRYVSWDDALTGHHATVRRLTGWMNETKVVANEPD